MKNVYKLLIVLLVIGLFCSLAYAWPWSSDKEESTSAPKGSAKTMTNSIGIEFVLVPAGSFQMGCDKNFDRCDDNALPRHNVKISKPFYLGKYEVTQEQWVSVMGNNPSGVKGRLHPVEEVSWNDVQKFIGKLNTKEGTNKYRLPTEAEWEYAARAGSNGKWCFGDDESQLSQYAWYDKECKGNINPVGKLQPNRWGLYDMHGNVWEWVNDRFGENYYSDSPSTDPQGPSSGPERVNRGGSYCYPADWSRSAYRYLGWSPSDHFGGLGFRLAKDAN